MVKRIDWSSNPNNEKDLIKLRCPYFQTDEGRNLFVIPLIINSGKITWSTTKEKTEATTGGLQNF